MKPPFTLIILPHHYSVHIIRQFINIDEIATINNLDNLNEDNLKTLVDWFFRKNDQNKSRVLGNNDNLTKLDEILSSQEITNQFIAGLSLKDAYDLTRPNSISQGLNKVFNELSNVRNYNYKAYVKTEEDIESLKDIVGLCKEINALIDSKEKDPWSL